MPNLKIGGPDNMYAMPFWRDDIGPDRAERLLKERIAEIIERGGSVRRLMMDLLALQEDRERARMYRAGKPLTKRSRSRRR